jgi:hypothetical protein
MGNLMTKKTLMRDRSEKSLQKLLKITYEIVYDESQFDKDISKRFSVDLYKPNLIN